jgi:hypothetical protein
MNRNSASRKRPAKPTRSPALRKPSPRKSNARASARKPEQSKSVQITALDVVQMRMGQTDTGKIKVTPAAAIGPGLRAHKFHVGQTVFYTSSPISRPGASGSYRVVRLLPSDGEDYQYRIKHAMEAFERVAKESQLELEA